MGNSATLADKLIALGELIGGLPYRQTFQNKLQRYVDRKKNKTLVESVPKTAFSSANYFVNNYNNARS